MGELRKNHEAYDLFKQIMGRYGFSDEKALRLCLKRWGEREGHCATKNKTVKPKHIEKKDEDFEFLSIELDISEIDVLKNQYGKSKYIKSTISNLRLIIWKYTKLPCVLAFHDPRIEGEKSIFEAHCPLRRCTALVVCETIENNEKLRISWTESNDAVKHENKAKLTGEVKSKVLDMLEKHAPIVARSNLVNEYMDSTDNTCPLVPYIRNMYQMKYRNRNETKTMTDKNPISAIAQMRGMPEFYNCIDEVDYVPFACLYSTPSQQRFSKEESEKKRTTLSIDSSGVSVILPPECEISARTNTMKRCMLYNIVMLGSKTSKVVYQMVTQTHTSSQISKMIDIFKTKQHHEKNPKEIFIDESPALFLGCCKAFLSMNSTNEYMDYCFDCLMENKKSSKTFIRIDRSHVVKTIKRIKKIKQLKNPRTVFYQRALGYLIQINDFEEAKNIMKELFRCINQQFLVGNDERRNNLINCISSHDPFKDFDVKGDDNDDENNDYTDPFECEDTEPRAKIKRNKFFHFVRRIAEENRSEHVSDENIFESLKMNANNPLYAPEIETTLIEVLSKLPMYGNILCECFESTIRVPSSSATEVTFRVLKHEVFQLITKLAVDKWLGKHLNFLNGIITGEDMAISADEQTSDMSGDGEVFGGIDGYKKSYKQPVLTDSETADSETDDKFDEKLKHDIWKSINEGKQPRSKKLNRCKTSILNPDTSSEQIPIFPNKFEIKGEKGAKNVEAQRMCAFNSILHFHLACYADILSFKSQVDENDGKYFEIIRRAMTEGITKAVHKEKINFILECYTNDLDCTDKKTGV